uniref:(California timema) hypothetical protein n=1 Tax=Timema californicum TaxID=61474 RepID=A0A7R9JA58_TIMCA|nr:unnamed protein product [Timema californicum]
MVSNCTLSDIVTLPERLLGQHSPEEAYQPIPMNAVDKALNNADCELAVLIEVDSEDGYIKTVDQNDRENESNSDLYACKWGKEVEPFCEKQHSFENGTVGSAPQNPEIIEKYGYTAQTHKVVTEDSYILTLHRIPGRQINQDDGVNRRVVLVLHGLLASSAAFVELGPEKGLGFILSDEGFDVWLGNFRGNTYSRGHVRPDIPHHVYWNFSMHEMGQYDIPAMIDYILKISGQKHLQIVAHSTGATSCYIMACLHTKYSAKISLLTSIAPLGPSGFLDPILKKEVKLLADRIMAMLSKNDVHYFAPSYDWLANYTVWFCQKDLLDDNLCKIRRLLGFNSKKLSEGDLSVVSSHFPAGTSVKFMIHLAQIMTTHFRRYDYGPVENLYYYADKTPPSYDVSVGVPLLSIVYSMVDMVAPQEDVRNFAIYFPSVDTFYVVEEFWNNMDFIWADDLKYDVYGAIITSMKKFP